MQRGHLEVSAPQGKGQPAEAAFGALARAPDLMHSAKEDQMKTVKAARLHSYDGAKALRIEGTTVHEPQPAKFSYAFTRRE